LLERLTWTQLYQLDDQLAFSAALQYLENTLLKLLANRPACLLLPTSWAKHGAVLKTLAAKRDHPQITHAVEKLDARNSRLLQSSRTTTPSSRTPAAQVFRKLDSINYKSPLRIEDLSYECMEITSNAPQLISILLQWSCSCYRGGAQRIYLATRLLRRWSHLGADIYEGVVSYLQNMTWAETGELHVLLRIVAELVRSKHFSAGRYLQWLIATGSVGRDVDLSSVSPQFILCICCANSIIAFLVANTVNHRSSCYWALGSSPQPAFHSPPRKCPFCRVRSTNFGFC
jgi:mediator of RNA polymerase II transcription subunit 12